MEKGSLYREGELDGTRSSFWVKLIYQSLERKVVIFRQVSERAVLRQAFTRWTVAEREVLLGRVRDQRATKSNWAVWRSRLEGVRRLDGMCCIEQAVREKSAERLDRLIPLTQAKNRAVLQATLRNWQTALSAQRTQLLRAQDTYNAHRLASAFAIWRTAARKIESDRDMADKARVFFVLRQVVRVWKVARERKRQEAWAEGRRVELMRRVFDGKPTRTDRCVLPRVEADGPEWRAEAKRSVNGKKLADEFRKASDQVSCISLEYPSAKLKIPAPHCGHSISMDQPRHLSQISPTRRLRGS